VPSPGSATFQLARRAASSGAAGWVISKIDRAGEQLLAGGDEDLPRVIALGNVVNVLGYLAMAFLTAGITLIALFAVLNPG